MYTSSTEPISFGRLVKVISSFKGNTMEKVQVVTKPSAAKEIAVVVLFCALLMSAFFLGRVGMVDPFEQDKIVLPLENALQKDLAKEREMNLAFIHLTWKAIDEKNEKISMLRNEIRTRDCK
jgi:hypothetical protein